jgi:glycosyltransferase involved in cell wall biosynthesis
MKITFFTSGSIRSNFSYRALTLAGFLRASGHKVSIVTPQADKYNDFKPEKIREINGIKIIQPFQFVSKRLEINLLPYILSAVLSIIRNKADVIYIYKPTPISIVGILGKIFHHSTVVVDMDDLGAQVMKHEGHPWYQQKLVGLSEYLAVRYADRIIAASTYLFKVYKKQYPRKPIYLLPNGAESSLFKRIITSKQKKNIVFLGAINQPEILDPLFEILPEIVKKHPDVHVTIIGDGTYLSYFKNKCKSPAISSTVSFTGWLPLMEVQKYLRGGDIGYCYMPDEFTNRAASNMKVAQYMARGVLPLVSRVGDLPSYVGYGKVGYIALPDNSQSLLKTILAALDSRERRQKAKEAQSFAKEHFEWKKLATSFEAWLFSTKGKNNKRKKVYVISTEVPSLDGGAPIRNLNLIKGLAKAGFTVRVICITSDSDKANVSKLQNIKNVTVHPVNLFTLKPWGYTQSLILQVIPYMYQFRKSGLDLEIKKLLYTETPDIVQLEQINGYYSVSSIIPELKKRKVKVVLDAHNVEQDLLRQTLIVFPFFKRLIGKWILNNFIEIENRATHEADAILTCSENDREFFKSRSQCVIKVIPNGIDTQYFKGEQISDKPFVLFMGGLSYPPNEDAIRWYIDSIHDMVGKAIPDYKLFLIGGNSPRWLSEKLLIDKRIINLGFVPDVRKYLAKAAVCVSPMRYGSGTGIKSLTYMATGHGTVSTTVGARGLEVKGHRDIMIADTPSLFAATVARLLKDKNLNRQLGINARKQMVKKYDWSIINENLVRFYTGLLNNTYANQ